MALGVYLVSPNDWAAVGVVITLLAGWVGAVHKRIANIHQEFMPRREAMDKFQSIERRIDRDVGRLEESTAKEFARMHTKLDYIIEGMSKKVDR